MAGDPSFTIPSRPTRNFPYSGGVEYEGETMFLLDPRGEFTNEELATLLTETLTDGPYRYGDFLNLPMALYLVRDDETGDVFRVSVRDGCLRFHVLPETESAGLCALYERIDGRTDVDWHVECRTGE